MPDSLAERLEGAGAIRRASGRSGLVTVFASVAGLLILLVSGWSIFVGYEQALRQTEVQTGNLAQAFASHAGRALGEAAVSLNRLALTLGEGPPLEERSEADLNGLIRQELQSSPQVSGLLIINAAGRIVAGSTLPEKKLDLGDREYFRYHASTDDPGLRVNMPITSRVTGEPVLAVTRRITGPAGSFRGVLSAGLLPDYFTGLYATVDLGAGAFVEIIDDKGRILLDTRSQVDDRVSRVFAEIEEKERFSGGLVSTAVAAPEGNLLVALAPIERTPLFLLIAQPEHEALAEWRNRLVLQAAGTLVALLVLGYLSWIQARQARRLRMAEEAHHQAAETLRLVIDSMAEAVIVADPEGRVHVHNRAARQLFRRDLSVYVIGRDSSGTVLLEPDGATVIPADQRPVAQALTGIEATNRPVVVRPHDIPDQDIIATISARCIRNSRGQIIGAVGVFRDVTQERRNERRLQQAQKLEALGQLTGGLAHDFNNLLTIILGNAELLGAALAADERQAYIARAIVRAAERGAELTRGLLAIARRQPLQPTATDLNDIVREMELVLRSTLGEDITLVTSLAPDLPPALVDVAQTQSAIINLALNARDAMPEGGRLTIETGIADLDEAYASRHQDVRPGRYVLLALTDSGRGIPATLREKVLEPFFTTKPPGKGSGLGLAIVEGFVRQSGGHLKIYSEVGHGTSVKLYLPPAGQVEAREPRETASPSGRGERILVVEDDPMVREHVCSLLEGLGYLPRAAETGAEALALVDSGQPFDLLFTDVILPGGMDGRRLADAVHERRPTLPVVFTSGYSENAIIHNGRLDPDVVLLQKPYRHAELARLVRQALDAGESAGDGR